MPARTTGRAKFDFRGRPFIWWIDGDRLLRIASEDKRFVVSTPLLRETECASILTIHGSEFLRIEPSEARPIGLEIPTFKHKSIGAWVEQLLEWSFDDSHEILRVNEKDR